MRVNANMPWANIEIYMIKKFTGLRAKLLLLIAIGLILLFAILFLITKLFLQQGYSKLEHDKTLIQVNSAESLLKEQSDQLSSVTRDYAHWDDTYHFIKTQDPAYLKSNFNDTTFSNIKINAIIIVNLEGEIVFKKGLDFITGQPWRIPQQLEQAASKGGVLVDPENDDISGLFQTSEGLFVVSAFDVRDSVLTKGRLGTLIMVRPLDKPLIAHIAKILGAKLDIQSSLNSNLVDVARLSSKNTVEIKPLNNKLIVGYKAVEDISGTSKLILRVASSREIFEQGKASLNFIYWSALSIALLLTALSWLMDRLVLKRLEHLIRSVKHVANLATPAARIKELEGRDEIASLGHDINAMLERLDESQHALELEKNRSQITLSTLSGITDAVITCDDSEHVVYMNAAAERLTGVLSSEANGKAVQQLFHLVTEDKLTPIDGGWITDHFSTIEEVILKRIDGQEFIITKMTSALSDHSAVNFGTVTVLRDVTAIRALSKQLSYQASHDALTGLINRYEFEQKLQDAIEDAVSENRVHCFAYLDLDQFKIVNDTSGHMAGDALLKQLCAELKTKMRSADTFARLGGDEFAILLMGCDLDKAKSIVNDLLSVIQKYRFNYDDKIFKVGASIGLTEISQTQSFTLSELFAITDSACYTAKKEGGNRIQTYIPDERELKQRFNHVEWVSRINQSLEENQFVLYMQRMHSFVLEGEPHCEILIRMKDQGNRVLLPIFFLPAAERYNLMPLIDRWVVAEAFSIIASKGDTFPYTCAINLSGQTLSDEGFQHYVLDQFKKHKVNPNRICFEITETAVITHLEKARQFIRALKMVGCRFSLDDFGSGLSSFGYLKNLEVDFLKIDGMFVKSIVDNKIDRAMVDSINNVGHVMQLKTIAEFAENDDIINMLEEIGVDYAQGYGVAMPELFEHYVANDIKCSA